MRSVDVRRRSAYVKAAVVKKGTKDPTDPEYLNSVAERRIEVQRAPLNWPSTDICVLQLQQQSVSERKRSSAEGKIMTKIEALHIESN